jgi:hypothetical protein
MKLFYLKADVTPSLPIFSLWEIFLNNDLVGGWGGGVIQGLQNKGSGGQDTEGQAYAVELILEAPYLNISVL